MKAPMAGRRWVVIISLSARVSVMKRQRKRTKDTDNFVNVA
jgi:hypothetical protein